MWRRRKMRCLLSCLFSRVLSLVLHRFSCAELADPAQMWDMDGALLCDQGGSAGISRDWQVMGWLCWNWSPHQHQPWCFIWKKSQVGSSPSWVFWFLKLGVPAAVWNKCEFHHCSFQNLIPIVIYCLLELWLYIYIYILSLCVWQLK